MNYSMLKNQVFIYLRANYSEYKDKKINFSDLGRKLGIDRRTASSLYSQCRNYLEDQSFDIIKDYHLEIDDNILRAVCIYRDLNPEEDRLYTIAKELKISATSLIDRNINFKKERIESSFISGVYGFFNQGVLIYVGSSGNIDNRLQAHELNFERDKKIALFYEY